MLALSLLTLLRSGIINDFSMWKNRDIETEEDL